MGSKRGSGYEAGLGSGVLTAPGESYAFEPGVKESEGREAQTRTSRQDRGEPAPAGAYQRGYAGEGFEEPGGGAYAGRDDEDYVPRRGKLKLRFRGFPRSVVGRIAFGVVVLVLLGAVAVAVGGTRFYLMHDGRFVLATSDDIQITGAEHLTRDQILTVFGADLERNIFRVSSGGAADRSGAAAVGGACDGDAAAAGCAAGEDYGADAGGFCAAGNADRAGGCEVVCCWICHRIRRAIRTIRFRC